MMNTCLTTLRKFVSEEDGAMTLDYLILMAGMIGLTIAGTAAVRSETATVNGTISTSAADASISSSL